MIRKFAKADILDVRYSANKLNGEQANERFSKLAKPSEVTDDGYLYVTVRAISSRVNKNNDGWPSMELARTDPGYGYKTFEGRPIFVDHNNDDPDRTRGVVVNSKLHVEDEKKASSFDPYYADAPEAHMPPTWIELMLEVDAHQYPKLAKEIIKGNIDSVSMGANIEISKCSVCEHEAENPTEYCSHVQNKGATFEVTSDTGEKSHKKAYEDCYGVNFFEISFVFDPADETALVSDMSAERKAALQAIASLEAAGAQVPDELRKQAAGGPGMVPPRPEWEGEEIGEAPIPGQDPADVPYHERGDAQMTHDWRLEQFQALGLSGVEAEAAIQAGIDYHDLGDWMQLHPGATAAQALRIISKKKEAIGPPGKDHHNLEDHQEAIDRERQLNHEPQADKMTAPQDVNTLRPEITCKNCGSTVEPDSAGQLICQECGYEVEPEGLDNPDLDAAKEIDIRQDNTEEVNPEGEMETELEADKGETEMPGKAPARSPVRPVAPISSTNSDPVSGEMKFSDAQTGELFTAKIDPKLVAAVASFMDKNAVEVEDEVELARLLSESDEFEGEPTIYDTAAGIEYHAAKVAATLDNADSKSDTKVNTDKKRPSNSAATQTASEKVISDQLAPVESNFKVVAETESTETSNEETDMANEKTADRETIKRVEEDGSGVRREEEIVKEYGPMADGEPTAEGDSEEVSDEAEAVEGEGEQSVDPRAEGDAEEVSDESTDDSSDDSDSSGFTPHNIEEEEKVPAMASVEEGKLMAALKLAKLASSLGVITADEELEFAGELEAGESLAEIAAREKMLTSVKEAGLSKKRRAVVASRLPSFNGSSKFAAVDEDDTDDEALFL